MGRKFSNIMMLGAIAMMGSVIPSGFINSFDYTNKPSIEYSTKRDTFQFKQIHGMYKAYRAYLTTVYGEING